MKNNYPRKGIILAGGYGTRLYPITKAISKHLLPIYDKPMIYYSLSLLFLAKIREIQLISTPRDIPLYKDLLGNGSRFGAKIFYKTQQKPKGIAHAIQLSKKFIGKSPIALVLGDNFFFGNGLKDILIKANLDLKNSTIFLQEVNNARDYGVANFYKNKKLRIIIEKPSKSKSNFAVTGMYFYNNKVLDYVKNLKFSKRGELEITDLNNIYIKKHEMKFDILKKGMTWMDCGTINQLYKVSNYVEMIQSRQNIIIGFLEEIAYQNNWITKAKLKKSINAYGKNEYTENIKKLI